MSHTGIYLQKAIELKDIHSRRLKKAAELLLILICKAEKPLFFVIGKRNYNFYPEDLLCWKRLCSLIKRSVYDHEFLVMKEIPVFLPRLY